MIIRHLANRRMMFIAAVVILVLTPFLHADGTSDALKRAVTLAMEGDTNSALKIIRPLADSGNAEAQHYLAKMLFAGQGIGKDTAAAVRWWRLAAEQDYREAQVHLGAAYAGGHGVPQDRIEGLKWVIIAGADDGFAYSMIAQGMSNRDIETVKSLARRWRDKNTRLSGHCLHPYIGDAVETVCRRTVSPFFEPSQAINLTCSPPTSRHHPALSPGARRPGR